MVVGFTTTYAISAYHHCYCEFESRSGRGVQHYVIKFVCDLRQVAGFLRVFRFPPPLKRSTPSNKQTIFWHTNYIYNALINIYQSNRINIQYWSVDGKNRIYLTRLRNGVKDELLASLSPRFAPSKINSIFTVNRTILYLSCNPRCPQKSF